MAYKVVAFPDVLDRAYRSGTSSRRRGDQLVCRFLGCWRLAQRLPNSPLHADCLWPLVSSNFAETGRNARVPPC